LLPHGHATSLWRKNHGLQNVEAGGWFSLKTKFKISGAGINIGMLSRGTEMHLPKAALLGATSLIAILFNAGIARA
jgi:hypothetical protein